MLRDFDISQREALTQKELAFISSHRDRDPNGNHSYQAKSVCLTGGFCFFRVIGEPNYNRIAQIIFEGRMAAAVPTPINLYAAKLMDGGWVARLSKSEIRQTDRRQISFAPAQVLTQ